MGVTEKVIEGAASGAGSAAAGKAVDKVAESGHWTVKVKHPDLFGGNEQTLTVPKEHNGVTVTKDMAEIAVRDRVISDAQEKGLDLGADKLEVKVS